MKETEFRSALEAAYPAPSLSDDRLEAIGRKVRLASGRPRRRKAFVIGAGICAGLATLVGSTYPIAQANWFGAEVRRNLAAAGPYMVTIRGVEPPEHVEGEWTNTRPFKLLIDGPKTYIVDSTMGQQGFSYVDSASVYHEVHPASKIQLLSTPDPNVASELNQPVKVMQDLGDFDPGKRIRVVGDRVVNGQRAQEVRVVVSPWNGQLVLDIDPEKGLPLAATFMATQGKDPSEFPVLRFDYTYDPDSVQKAAREYDAALVGLRQLNCERDRGALRERIFQRPICSRNTGRDLLSIYRVEQNSEGDVMVLYTCRGYHSVEDNVGDWLQLDDARGTRWLSSLIDMSFSKLAPKGEGLKAQVFYRPDRPEQLSKGRLSIRLDEWEYLRSSQPSTKETRTLDIGTVRPSSVLGAPLWYFYAFGNHDESWLSAMGQKLRFLDAMKGKRFADAIRIGRAFERTIPDHMTELWFEPSDLDRGLAEAYRGLGDEKSAKAYEPR